MDPININHSRILHSTAGIKPTNDILSSASNTSQPAPTEIKLSPVESKVTLQTVAEENSKSRFSSMEEFSQHKTNLVAQWVTFEELESGTRRPYATAEDARLSQLTIKELMEESNNLPRIDKNGHLQNSIFGTEQGDRISTAITNKIFEAQYDYKKSAERVESAVTNFKNNIEKKLNISADSYDIEFRNGKITAVGKGASEESLKKIQEIIDNPKDTKASKVLAAEIEMFNKASLTLVENALTQYIHGATKDPYLEKNVSVDWLMEGMNYSNATKSGQVSNQYTALWADAREKYNTAVKNGTHLSNYDIDPGIIELTNLRKNIDVNA